MITEYDRMIDEFNADHTGWARFSPDKTKRYRLGRVVNPRILEMAAEGTTPAGVKVYPPIRAVFGGMTDIWINRVVFVLLNPSNADAFSPDPTLDKCCKYAARWGADVVEIVNLFALITPYPSELKNALERGAGEDNDRQIVEACTQSGVITVIAGWGRDGELADRAGNATSMLRRAGVTLHCLGVTENKMPKHPLARGKHFMPLSVEPKIYASPESGVIAPGSP